MLLMLQGWQATHAELNTGRSSPTYGATDHALWLPNLAPQWTLGLIALFAIICVNAGAILATSQPSLGVTWHADDTSDGLIAEVKSKAMPLKAGDEIVAIRQLGAAPITLTRDLILEDPDIHASYSDFNRFFETQASVAATLRQPRVVLIRADDQTIEVPTRDQRPLAEFPFAFWIYNLSGATCLLISSGVWSFRRGDPAAASFALSGVGFFCGMLFLSVYGTRELALEPRLFRALSAANHFSMLLFTYSLLVMFWYFPRRLGKSYVAGPSYAAMGAIWINETLQWYEVPGHAFYILTFLVPYSIGVPLIMAQWRRAGGQPVERAAIQWIVIAVFISLAVVLSVLVIPPIYGRYLAFSIPMATLMVVIMFVGMAFGITRYRLFDLDRWWLTAWAGFLSMALLLGLDLLLVRALSIGPPAALALSLLAVGWVYFPTRQWLWNRLVEPQSRHLEHYLPCLIDSLFSLGSPTSFQQAWHVLLRDMFHPLKIVSLPSGTPSPSITQHGLILRSPTPIGKEAIELIAKSRGTRLFVPQDVELVIAILGIARQVIHLRQAEENATTTERNRIMRALHDDVSPMLLTLLHRANSEADAALARSALASLREAIYTLQHRNNILLEEAFADWRAEVNERIEGLPLRVHWSQNGDVNGARVSAWQYVNFRSILREAITNILKHSQASEIAICYLVEQQSLTMAVTNDGCARDVDSQWPKVVGQGIANMRKRTDDLGGTIEWVTNDSLTIGTTGNLTVRARFPLVREKAEIHIN